MSFAFVGGASQDPADKPGVANMLSGLLDEGAGDLDSQAFQAALDDYVDRALLRRRPRCLLSARCSTLVDNRAEAVRLLQARADQAALRRRAGRAHPRPDRRRHPEQRQRDPDEIASDALAQRRLSRPSLWPAGRGHARRASPPSPPTICETYFAQESSPATISRSPSSARSTRTRSAALLDEVFGDLPIKSDLVAVPRRRRVAAGSSTSPMAIPQTVIRFAGKGLKRNDPGFHLRHRRQPTFSAAAASPRGSMRKCARSAASPIRSRSGFRRLDHAGIVLRRHLDDAPTRPTTVLTPDRGRDQALRHRRPDAGRARQGEELSDRQLSAPLQHLRPDRRASSSASSSTISASTMSTEAQRPDRCGDHRRRPARGQAPLRRRPRSSSASAQPAT